MEEKSYDCVIVMTMRPPGIHVSCRRDRIRYMKVVAELRPCWTSHPHLRSEMFRHGSLTFYECPLGEEWLCGQCPYRP